MTGRAPTIDNTQLVDLLAKLQYWSESPIRDTAAILLSFKAGLRIAEITGLKWRDVLTPEGGIGTDVIVPATISKSKRARTVPMHPALRAILIAWARTYPHGIAAAEPVIAYKHGPGPDGDMMAMHYNVSTLRLYLTRLYQRCGYQLTTHSGRRSAITALARAANIHGGSIYDVQAFAGHSHISTTEAYVDLSPNLRKMVDNL